MKKSQMSLEFMMIYGIALMIILGMFAVMMDFGITTPQNVIPEQCYIEDVFMCSEYIVYGGHGAGVDDSVWINLTNHVGRGITILRVNVTSLEDQSDNCTIYNDSRSYDVGPSENFVLEFNYSRNDCLGYNDLIKVEYELKYVIQGGEYFNKTVDGILISKVSPR